MCGVCGECGQRADQLATKRIQSTWHKQRGTVASHKDYNKRKQKHKHKHEGRHQHQLQWAKGTKKQRGKQFSAQLLGIREKEATPRLATLSKYTKDARVLHTRQAGRLDRSGAEGTGGPGAECGLEWAVHKATSRRKSKCN